MSVEIEIVEDGLFWLCDEEFCLVYGDDLVSPKQRGFDFLITKISKITFKVGCFIRRNSSEAKSLFGNESIVRKSTLERDIARSIYCIRYLK